MNDKLERYIILINEINMYFSSIPYPIEILDKELSEYLDTLSKLNIFNRYSTGQKFSVDALKNKYIQSYYQYIVAKCINTIHKEIINLPKPKLNYDDIINLCQEITDSSNEQLYLLKLVKVDGELRYQHEICFIGYQEHNEEDIKFVFDRLKSQGFLPSKSMKKNVFSNEIYLKLTILD